jgi:hypothetical protein
MRRSPARLLACLLALAAVSASADTLELRDGRVLQGTYKGGTAQQLHFEINGVLHGVPVTDVAGISFLGGKAGAAAPPAAPAQPPAAPSVARVAAGTRLRVRLSDTLDTHVNTEGDVFEGVLEMELKAAGKTIVAPRSAVSGRIAEIQGSPAGSLSLELTGLQVGEAMQPIVTGSQQILAVGGVPGSVPAAPDPEGNRIAAGTLLEFRLLQPFDVPLR